MLITLLLWVYITILTFLAGDALLRIGRWLAGPLPVLAAPLVCLCGAAGLTVALGWVWLVAPVSLTTHLVIAVLLTGYALWQRPKPQLGLPRWPYPGLGWVSVGLLFGVVLLRSVQFPRLIDTGGYHAPMIEWIHAYAVVPGLANLNYRFGFNNSWFLLSAFFRFQLTPEVPWHGLNGWLMVMLGWFSLTEWHRWQATPQKPFSAWLGGWLGVGFLLIFHWTLSSPSPDLPTHVYVVLCFWTWLRRAEPDPQPATPGWGWLLLVFSLLALTTKLSAVTVVLLPLLVLQQHLFRRNWRILTPWTITAVSIVGCWLVGNVVLTGYLVYPSLSPLTDWFSVDWKVPPGVIETGLKNLQEGTRGDSGGLFSLAWVPYWFKTRPILEQAIAILLLLSPLPVVWHRKMIFSSIPGYGVALLAAGVGVIFWFVLAPEIRFGAGNVLLALGLCYGPLLSRATLETGRLQWISLASVGLVGLVLGVAAIRREPVGWLLPAGYPNTPLRYYVRDNHRLTYPTDDNRVINKIRGYWGNCYDADLPCSPYPIPGLHWRGKALPDGFRTENAEP